MQGPTPHLEVNVVLRKLLAGVREASGIRFVGLCLTGSLAAGDFDRDSDVDLVVVTDSGVDDEAFVRLDAMHQRIATLDSWCASQLEGTYVAREALRRFHPDRSWHPSIEGGRGERLKLARCDPSWVVHCSILRERGIAVAGPLPHTLVDPVTSDDLRVAMRQVLRGWTTDVLRDPSTIGRHGYQSYVVRPICRILYTLERGEVVSKRVAARWTQQAMEDRWRPLVDVAATLALMRPVGARTGL